MAVETNKTKWTDAFAKSIGASTSPGGQGEGTPTDKYDALEYTSYKDMLSSKIQASVAKDQAQKYIGASLSNAGFAGQGIAESTRTGIMGSYGKAITAADETHQANLLDISKQRAEETELAGEEKWQSAMTMLQQATSKEDLDYVKTSFYNDMTDDQKKMFDYYYASYSNDLGTRDDPEWLKANTVNSQGYGSYDEMLKGGLRTDNIDYGVEDVEKEALLLFDRYNVGRQDGDVVRLEHQGGGSTNGVYLIYYNGKWYKTDKSHYDGAQNKAFFKGAKFQSGTGTFTEK